MSLPEDIEKLQKIYKPKLKLKIGDLVYLKTDTKKQFPMTIINFELEDDTCYDYLVKWLNCNGGIETHSFPEECITINN